MIKLTKRVRFESEKRLEDYLESRLWLTGQDLLIIGRQVKVDRWVIDLLAIDSTGTIYIIELKWEEASPSVIGQVFAYSYSVKGMNREKIIQVVAHGARRTDLVDAFQRHFGHPLPETVNELPALMIIAESFHAQTAASILALRERFSLTVFRYVKPPDGQSDSVRLISCCRSDQDVKDGTHLKSPSVRPDGIVLSPNRRPSRQVPVDEHVQIGRAHV